MAVTAPASTRMNEENVEVGMRKERSLWSDAWRRLRRNKAAMLGLIMITIFAVMAIFADVLAQDPTLNIVPGNGYRPPAWVQSESSNVRESAPGNIRLALTRTAVTC